MVNCKAAPQPTDFFNIGCGVPRAGMRRFLKAPKGGATVRTSAISNDPTLTAREGRFKAVLSYPNTSDYQYRQVKKYGLFYDFRFLRYIAAVHKHKKFRIAFDVGSCFANHAVYFGKLLDCHVECFEPNKNLLRYISANLSQALVSHRIHNVALGDADSEGAIDENVSNLGGSRFVVAPEVKDQSLVQITTLDKMVGRECLSYPCFIKVDTEGFECQVLRGAEQTMLRSSPELFLEISPENRAEASALLRRLGYKLVFHYGKNYHYSKTLSQAARILLALEAVSIDVRVSLTRNLVEFGQIFQPTN